MQQTIAYDNDKALEMGVMPGFLTTRMTLHGTWTVYFGHGSVDAKGRLRTILLAIKRVLFYRAAQHSLASIIQ